MKILSVVIAMLTLIIVVAIQVSFPTTIIFLGFIVLPPTLLAVVASLVLQAWVIRNPTRVVLVTFAELQ